MREGGRLAAAIEVLAETARGRPVSQALADWGRSHRFAGAGDRAAIGNLVYDALRRRSEIAWRMGEDTPRALALGAAGLSRTAEQLDAAFTDDDHAPDPLTDAERAALSRPLADAPEAARANLPDWITPSFQRLFGADWAEEGAALSRRPPLDLRVNTLLASRDKALKSLARLNPQTTPVSPVGVRFPAGEGPSRTPNVTVETAYQKGWVEVQDEASQCAALLAGAAPGMQVLDYCAGAGGKTLAMAAAMRNTGQVFAYDSDRARLAPIHDRLRRARARNVQMREPGADLAELLGRMDVVLADAPCTGSGVWRRHPDAKWRLTQEALSRRMEEQDRVLAEAALYVKPGGELVYATCSLLPEENAERVAAFLAAHQDFEPVSLRPRWTNVFGEPEGLEGPMEAGQGALLLTPRRIGADGFFVAALRRT